jgi:hypothetical protein
VQKLSYAEVVKKVEEDGSRGRDPERSSRSVPVQWDMPTSDTRFSKFDFFWAFIAMVINYCRDGT